MSSEICYAYRTRAFLRLLCMFAALFALLPSLAWAGGYACGAPPSAYIDGEKGVFHDYNDTSGFPVFNSDHCYGHAIYSTSGKDTYSDDPFHNRTVTNSGFGYQCVELAYRYMGWRWSKWIWVSNGASDLCNGPLVDSRGAPVKGLQRFRPGGGTPVPGDLFVFANGVCGADAQYGHVAVITRVWNKDSVQIAQQNVVSEKYTIQNVKLACACSIIHADNNTYSNGPPVETPADSWSPSTTKGGRGDYLHAGGSTPSTPPRNGCYCKSNDENSVWPLCCKTSN